jgi:hypothetical protein
MPRQNLINPRSTQNCPLLPIELDAVTVTVFKNYFIPVTLSYGYIAIDIVRKEVSVGLLINNFVTELRAACNFR